MKRGRAYQDGERVIVHYPTERFRLEGESDAAFLERMCAREEARGVLPKGVLKCDTTSQDLPPYSARDRWVIKGGRVVDADDKPKRKTKKQ